MEDKRTSNRIPSSKSFKVYTSVANVPYTVKIENISEKGAFVKTPFLPNNNETITVEMIDQSFSIIYRADASVRWIKMNGRAETRGFGIEFSQNFPMDLLETLI